MPRLHHPDRDSRRDLVIALGLAAFVLLAGWWRLVPGVVGVYHDDAIYASTAISLAEGDGYRLQTLPGAPLQTKYPIGYPALLAPARLLSTDVPTVLAGMQWLTLAAAAGFVALFYLFVRRFGYASRGGGVAIALAIATAPMFLYVSTILLAESPFALALVASFWALEGAGSDATAARRSAWRGFLTGVVIALPALLRTLGLATTFGAALFLIGRRRLSWPVALGMATTTVPWLMWAWFGAGAWSTDPVSGYYLEYIGPWQQLAPDRLPWVFGLNTFAAANAILGLSATGVGTMLVNNFSFSLVPASVALSLFVIPGAIRFRHHPAALPLACYLLALVVWPWPPARFVLPVVGFLLIFWKDGVLSIARGLGYEPAATRVLWAGAIVIIGFNLVLQAQIVTLNRATGYPHAHTTFVAPTWSEYEALFGWIRDETEPDAVLASGLDTMVSLYTGRPALRPYVHRPDVMFYGAPGLAAGTPEEFVQFLRANRVRYVVDVPMPGFDEEDALGAVIARVRDEMPVLLVERYRGRAAGFVVYGVTAASDEE